MELPMECLLDHWKAQKHKLKLSCKNYFAAESLGLGAGVFPLPEYIAAPRLLGCPLCRRLHEQNIFKCISLPQWLVTLKKNAQENSWNRSQLGLGAYFRLLIHQLGHKVNLCTNWLVAEGWNRTRAEGNPVFSAPPSPHFASAPTSRDREGYARVLLLGQGPGGHNLWLLRCGDIWFGLCSQGLWGHSIIKGQTTWHISLHQ